MAFYGGFRVESSEGNLVADHGESLIEQQALLKLMSQLPPSHFEIANTDATRSEWKRRPASDLDQCVRSESANEDTLPVTGQQGVSVSRSAAMQL